mmetsp:Transcript_126080/g.362693  ORF Transcript_126080/g.362693 Transcript_126080/m.362693 type:complete len:207 (-) Transcript_126080:25-645(-)
MRSGSERPCFSQSRSAGQATTTSRRGSAVRRTSRCTAGARTSSVYARARRRARRQSPRKSTMPWRTMASRRSSSRRMRRMTCTSPSPPLFAAACTSCRTTRASSTRWPTPGGGPRWRCGSRLERRPSSAPRSRASHRTSSWSAVGWGTPGPPRSASSASSGPRSAASARRRPTGTAAAGARSTRPIGTAASCNEASASASDRCVAR